MRRAAIFGALMGVIVGGAILVVLSLQVSVVDWPGDARSADRPVAPEDAPAVSGAAELAHEPVASLAAPDRPPPPAGFAPDTAALTDRAGTTDPAVLPPGSSESGAVRAEPPSLADIARPEPPRPAVADALAPAPPRTGDVRVARPLEAAQIPVQIPVQQPVQSATPIAPADRLPPAAPGIRDPAPAAPGIDGVPVAQTAAGVPPRAPTGVARRRLPAGEPAATSAPQSSPAPVSGATTPARAHSGAEVAAAQRVAPDLASAAAPPDRAAPRAEPRREPGVRRAPMVLWLVTDPGVAAPLPGWAVAAGALADRAGAAIVPPPDDPAALARFMAALDGADAPGALLLRGDGAWPVEGLAPMFDLAALSGQPVIYPGATARQTVDLLEARGLRAMPVYASLDPAAPRAATDAALAAIAARAARDGVVAVQMPADPALLAHVSQWRAGIGARLEDARLSDLFGG